MSNFGDIDRRTDISWSQIRYYEKGRENIIHSTKQQNFRLDFEKT